MKLIPCLAALLDSGYYLQYLLVKQPHSAGQQLGNCSFKAGLHKGRTLVLRLKLRGETRGWKTARRWADVAVNEGRLWKASSLNPHLPAGPGRDPSASPGL